MKECRRKVSFVSSNGKTIEDNNGTRCSAEEAILREKDRLPGINEIAFYKNKQFVSGQIHKHAEKWNP